jgi:ornithine cyclodeaminase
VLTRPDASRLLIVGAGHIAGMMAEAYQAVRPITQVAVWNVRHGKAEHLAASLRHAGFDAASVTDLAEAVRTADIVTAATLASTPLVQGEWLQPGTHLDLIGGFRPDMREADDDAVCRARVFIDTPAALEEAGDITQPLAAGILRRDAICGTLAGLCGGEIAGRTAPDEITLFKSVGNALEDLAAASLVYRDAAAG